jgi:hypothetical protein
MKVIVFKGKHRDEYYDASTPELTRAAMLDQLRIRNGSGWYGDVMPFEETYTWKHLDADERAALAMDEDAIDALPEAAQKPLKKIRARIAEARRWHEADNKVVIDWDEGP